MPRFLLAIALAFNCLAALAAEPLPEALPPEQERAALAAAESTGTRIYLHDRAAAVATDAALKLRQFKKDQRVRGWITEERGDQILVTFIDQTPAALYRIPVSEQGVAGAVQALAAPEPLTTYETGAAAARMAALSFDFQPCSKKYNSVVLPPTGEPAGHWWVYLIPGTTQKNVVPFGGTYRLEVEGASIVSHRGFTRTCIALQTDPRAVALAITHLLDPTPTEAHVYWSLWANKPLYVTTPPNGTVWRVDGNRIELIERRTARSEE